MFKDKYSASTASSISPAEECYPITPRDDADLPEATKALYVGTGGDIRLLPVQNETEVVFRNVPSGSILDVRTRAVRATDTTAADLVALV